ncbi:uncharacterized protein LOC111226072 [Seriola dumerili]|uniref:uncharacterized protein LOC111226072 n=1 Tax=Seriola dumerili TaxID=41447 RepID=UPI000BBE6E7C|nr:uncharacterized protein LOC111226072 [Seriola dumerili]
MLLGFFLLFFFCESTVTFLTTKWPIYVTSLNTPRTTMTEMLSPLLAVATPDYPVAAGQTVNLHCSAFSMPPLVNWSWQHLENMAWRQVGSEMDLTLTEPKQSGLYRCCAKTLLNQGVSHNLSVYIVAMQPTVGENLGIAAIVLSFLALIITLTILIWLGLQRVGGTMTISNTAAKGFPGPEKAPKGDFPQTESDGDVYMNYTSTNQAYTNLDPTNMTGDNVYSSLS